MSDSPTVIFIGGYGRSGSTLLSQLLDRHPDVVSVGELRHIWRRGFGEDQLCSCGEPFRACDFWRRVRSEVDDELGSGWAAEARALQDSVDRARFIPMLARPSLRTGAFRARLDRYLVILETLCRGIARISGCGRIVDTSKDPSHGFLLSASERLPTRVVHLVRDSRAVAYSWRRRKERPEIHWTDAEMPRLGPLRSSLEWTFYNLMAELLGPVAGDYTRVRYEQLAENTAQVLASLSARSGDGGSGMDLDGGDTFVPEESHAVSGNPVRFAAGTVTIARDTEWQTEMKRSDHLTATVLTWPFLRRYGTAGG